MFVERFQSVYPGNLQENSWMKECESPGDVPSSYLRRYLSSNAFFKSSFNMISMNYPCASMVPVPSTEFVNMMKRLALSAWKG